MTSPQEMVERALTLSKADSTVVIVDEVSSANLRWASNTLTTNGVTRSRDVTVIAMVGGAVGVVIRQGVTTEGLEDLVRSAEHTASNSRPAEDEYPLLGADGTGGDWEGPPGETSAAAFSEVAPSLRATFSRADADNRLLFGFATHEVRSTYLGSSTGLRARHDQPTGHIEMNGKSVDYTESAWVGAPAPDFSGVSLETMTDELWRRLAWSARRVDLPAGRYHTVLPPSAVADLMIYLYWSATARDAHDGRTVFARPGGGTRVGDRLAQVPVNLRSDPHAPSISCAPFVVAHQSSSGVSVFDNGSPLQPTSWIADGVLSALVQTRHSAGLTGLPFTPYVDNLVLDGPADGAVNEEELVSGVELGLLLTCLWYIREVDPQTLLLTGLTRDGVYLIQGGEITGEVHNFRFNESPVDLLSRIVRVGPTGPTLPREWSDYFTRVAMPPMHVADFNMSSVSPAS